MKNFYSIIEYILDIIKKDDNKLNALYYLWKRNNWMIDLRYLSDFFLKIQIDSPIFLLGNQGDGLTLISRILRRNQNIVNVTGNYKYWAGADEMINVYEPILTPELSGLFINTPYHKEFPPPYNWSHASNDLIDFYRKTEKDVNIINKKKLRIAIGMALYHHGKNIKNPRFLDKSQLFSVKMSFINKLLEDSNPYFIHITRNPFATIYRAAFSDKVKDIRRARRFLNIGRRFQICLEHWINVARCIEKDRNKVRNFIRIKFEDFLEYPELITKKLCGFLNLKFFEDMLPKKNHKFPFGTRSDKKSWFPLNPNININYINKIPKRYINIIFEKGHEYILKFGYNIP